MGHTGPLVVGVCCGQLIMSQLDLQPITVIRGWNDRLEHYGVNAISLGLPALTLLRSGILLANFSFGFTSGDQHEYRANNVKGPS